MNNVQSEKLIIKALKSDSLHKISRFFRIIKKPEIFLPYTFYWIFAKIFFPIKVNYKTLWGDKMRFYIPEGNEIYSYGFFEVYLFNFFLNFVREGDIIVDIGAHVGIYTKLASRLVLDSGKVYSFEPTTRTFNSLRENTKHEKNIIINNFALLNEEREISFEDYGPAFSVFNTFEKRKSVDYLPEPKTYKVRAIRLDDYFNKNKIDRCEFIKIDAEGAESLILKGMDYILENIKPVVSIEVGGGEEWEKNNQDSIKYLIDKNYLPYKLDELGYLHKHEIQEIYLYDNIIFIHRDKLDTVRDLIKD